MITRGELLKRRVLSHPIVEVGNQLLLLVVSTGAGNSSREGWSGLAPPPSEQIACGVLK